MNENRKLTAAILVSLSLIVMIFMYNIFGNYIESRYVSYFKRRLYYERIISKKGLSLHRARYWKEK